MRRRSSAYSIVATLCAVQLVFAMFAPQFSCQWGLAMYIAAGVAVMVALGSMPFFLRRAFSRSNRTPASLGFAMLGLLGWLLGLLIGFSSTNCG